MFCSAYNTKLSVNDGEINYFDQLMLEQKPSGSMSERFKYKIELENWMVVEGGKLS